MFIYGIDANVLTRARKTGTERYVLSMLKEMLKEPLRDDERVFLYTSKFIDELSDLPSGWEQKVLNWKPGKAWTHLRLSFELWRRTPDVFFSPAHEIPLLTGRTKIVSTVHDVAFRRFPDIYSARDLNRQEWAISRAVKKADEIITVSETTKNDLISLFGVHEEKITSIHLAVEPEDFILDNEEINRVLEKYDLEREEYCVSIGRIEKKKNIKFLVEALSGSGKRLVLGGTFSEDSGEIKEAIENSNGLVKILGYVPDEDLAGLIAGSFAYVFPSKYEGFGIPALEAMACGVPLIASDIPALKEIVGDAALLISPDDQNAWTRAVSNLKNEELRKVLIEKGDNQFRKFSWRKNANKTWEILKSLR